jgi:tetratricopeptide (TPR) repeat protein
MTVGFYWQLLAVSAIRAGQIDLALQAGREAYAIGKAQGLAPDSATWVSRLTGLARPLVVAQRWDEAMPVLQELLQRMPKVVGPRDTRLFSIRADLALARYMRGETRASAMDARGIVEEVTRLKEGRPFRPYLVLGIIERHEKQPAAAVHALEAALQPEVRIRDDEDRAEVRVELAQARLDLGQLDAAGRDLLDARALLDAAGPTDLPVRKEFRAATERIAALDH